MVLRFRDCLRSKTLRPAGLPGEAKIGDARTPVVADEDVGRLEVSMNQPRVVCRRESFCSLQ